MAPLALLPLLLAAAANANMMNAGEMGRMKRILQSPVAQRLADVLGLNLPEVPEYDVMANIQDLDINAMATQAGDSGCLPAGTQFSEETRSAISECVASAYNEVRRRPLGRRRRSIVQRAKERAMRKAGECLAERLSLVADDGTLSQDGVDAIIDGMTLPDEQLRAHKKNMSRLCITSTPEQLSGAAALRFQLRCVAEMNGLDCALGVSYQVSPTVGFLTLHGAGKCLCKGALPPPRAAMAYAACSADAVSELMRERLAATADAAGRRRRRRDVDMMSALQKMGGLEEIERAMGAGPAPARRCRPTLFRRCPPSAADRSQAIMAKLDEYLPRVEELAGPLDEAFASVPARADAVAACWFAEVEAVNDDGSVNTDKLKEMVAATTRPGTEPETARALQQATISIIDYCTAQGDAASVAAFTECYSGAAAYTCRLMQAIRDNQREQQQQQRRRPQGGRFRGFRG